jgi:hypothetical protein
MSFSPPALNENKTAVAKVEKKCVRVGRLRIRWSYLSSSLFTERGVARLVGIEGGVVSGVFNLESSDVEASDRRPRHDDHYHEA